MNNDERVFGMIGLGYWGRNILRNLYELGLLRIACDADEGTIKHWRETYADIDYTMTYADILNAEEIIGVVISTPAAMHYEVTKAALAAGKDVLVEKPLALTVREGEELVELAEREGRILMVGHILQYHPAVEKLKELVSSGGLGKILYIYSNRLNIGKLRTEENILWSFAPHDISVMLMLLEEEPESVVAFGGDYVNSGIFDTTLTTLEFRNGVKGHIFVSWLHPYKEQKMIVVGSEAMAVFDDIGDQKLVMHPHKIEWKDGKIPVVQKSEYEVIAVRKEEPLENELRHFAECVRRRRQPRTDGLEAVRVLRVLEMAELSLTSSGAVGKCGGAGDSVHESCYIDDDVEIGEGTRIWHFSHILSRSIIGRDCVIGQNCSIGPDVRIGRLCKIQNNVSVYKGVTLEDEVFCGPSCVFTNVYNPRAFIERKQDFMPTRVKRGATIGANATILCGATIGRYAVVGVGAVVRQDVADYAIVVGVPARQIGWACICGTTLRFDGDFATCDHCGNKVVLKNEALRFEG